MTTDDGDDTTSSTAQHIVINLGKRFSLGQIGMANVSYAPSFSYSMITYGGDIADIYVSATDMKIDFIKFDVLF
jgi:hypothetical protein